MSKKTLFLAVLLNMMSLSGAVINPNDSQSRSFAWNYDLSAFGTRYLGFNLYATTNLGQNISSWKVLTNIWATNLIYDINESSFSFTLKRTNEPPTQFFALTAWDGLSQVESAFSSVITDPKVSLADSIIWKAEFPLITP